ncbi:exostosin family protein [uncultured Lacinutrix sp.]|uniref:exostosin domain-containing protein n=1 Tax=uncultured Lacinutrix sp. TaxID=574032 RepID=UPI00263A03E4|nr:exostosin family protein [uncultured Lacinutrix sp.]
MLKLYTNTQFLSETHRREVFPLLFDMHFKQNELLLKYYSLVDTIETCDIVVFPIDYSAFLKHREALNVLTKAAKNNNKPIWIYTAGDFGFTNYIANSYTFRLGGFHSKLTDKSFILPSFINDPYLTQIPNGFSVIEKEEKPTIGFVGHAQSGIQKWIKEKVSYYKIKVKRYLGELVADKQPFYPSSIKRAFYLFLLASDKRLITNFILRNNYRAGVSQEIEKKKSTTEFYDNIFNTGYTFCSRGVGNFSVRFYETLAMGRIPILLNTDCRLPLDFIIDWNKHCIIIEENEVRNMPEIITKFHNSLSVDDFTAMQSNNRKLWETKLIRHNYFVVIHDTFIKKINANG